jgi:hypothetical protein
VVRPPTGYCPPHRHAASRDGEGSDPKAEKIGVEALAERKFEVGNVLHGSATTVKLFCYRVGTEHSVTAERSRVIIACRLYITSLQNAFSGVGCHAHIQFCKWARVGPDPGLPKKAVPKLIYEIVPHPLKCNVQRLTIFVYLSDLLLGSRIREIEMGNNYGFLILDPGAFCERGVSDGYPGGGLHNTLLLTLPHPSPLPSQVFSSMGVRGSDHRIIVF